jgi:hypothetical protein
MLVARSCARVVAAMARARRAGRWRAVGAAGSFVLAAVAGVVGNQLTGHLTPALVLFIVLLVAGVVVTYVLERGTAERDSGEEAGNGLVSRPGPGKRARGFDLKGAQGVQFGDYNRQENYFGPALEPDHDE